MKKKNILLTILSMMMTMLLVACGGSSGGAEKNPYEGKWIAVSAQALGTSMSIEEAFGDTFEFDLKNGGSVTFTVGDDSGKGKWAVKDKTFTLEIEGEKMEGKIEENTITFDDMLGMGLVVIFAKEGTDAANPDLYMTKEEAGIIGTWKAESVEELLGDGPKTSMDGVATIQDAMQLEFKGDRTVSVLYKSEKKGDFKWSQALGYFLIDTDEPSISLTLKDEQHLDVVYSSGDDYYTFHCVKVEK